MRPESLVSQRVVAVHDSRESARRPTPRAWVEGDLDVVRSEREPELTLFVPEIGAKSPAPSVRKALA